MLIESQGNRDKREEERAEQQIQALFADLRREVKSLGESKVVAKGPSLSAPPYVWGPGVVLLLVLLWLQLKKLQFGPRLTEPEASPGELDELKPHKEREDPTQDPCAEQLAQSIGQTVEQRSSEMKPTDETVPEAAEPVVVLEVGAKTNDRHEPCKEPDKAQRMLLSLDRRPAPVTRRGQRHQRGQRGRRRLLYHGYPCP